MKKIIQTFVAVVVVASMTGCATPYMMNRGRDAADILTIGMGCGLGAKARVGPMQVGLLLDGPGPALRGGQCCPGTRGMFPTQWDFQYPGGGEERFARSGNEPNPARGKDFDARLSANAPLWYQLYYGSHTPAPAPYYYSQIEVVADVGVGLRLGFNPGELLDFFLGWFGIDIYGDDIEMKKLKETSNQVPEDTARKLADPQH